MAERHLDRLRVQVAGLRGPLLALAFVRWQLQSAAIGQVKRFVAIQHGLHEIFSAGHG
jgi:hypothetical protein